jgi:hypothetical protein
MATSIPGISGDVLDDLSKGEYRMLVMRSVSFLGVVLLAVSCCLPARARMGVPEIGPEKLMSARVIVIGVAEPLSGARPLGIVKGRDGVTYLLGAKIRVLAVIRGTLKSKVVNVAPSPDANIMNGDWCVVAGKKYVFFLNPTESKDEFKPLHVTRCSLPIADDSPAFPKNAPTAKDYMRELGRAQVAHPGQWLVHEWFKMLCYVYDEKKDRDYFNEKLDHPNIYMAGRAMAVLCKNSPDMPKLYAKAFAFLKRAGRERVAGRWSDEIATAMASMLGDGGLTGVELRRWLFSGAPGLEARALAAIRQRGDRTMARDVTSLMRRKQRRIDEYRRSQYSCVEVLRRLAGEKKKTVGLAAFESKPDEEYKKWLNYKWDK